MKSLISKATGVFLLAGSLTLFAHNHTEKQYDNMDNIVQTAVANDNFSTLVTAVQSADLVEALSGEGPFTVFAPTNDAFAEIPEATLAALLMEENKGQLQGVLTYHVVPGKVLASDLQDGQVVETLNGETIQISLADGAKVNNIEIIETDIKTKNGVIHVINGVLIP